MISVLNVFSVIGYDAILRAFETGKEHRFLYDTVWDVTIQPAVVEAARSTDARLNTEFVRTFYDRVVPGIYSEFDGLATLPLIALRSLMVINPRHTPGLEQKRNSYCGWRGIPGIP